MTADEIFSKLQSSVPGLVKSDNQVKDYPSWTLPAQSVRAVCGLLRTRFSFDYLDVVTAVDWPGSAAPAAAPAPAAPAAAPTAAGRGVFELVYIVSSLSAGIKICLRCEIPREDPASVPSLHGIFMAADWQEREVFDLFGIQFEGHPNLKKILTAEGQQGHPLRKDYVHVPDAYD